MICSGISEIKHRGTNRDFIWLALLLGQHILHKTSCTDYGLIIIHVVDGSLLQSIMQRILAYLRSTMKRCGRKQTNSTPGLVFSKHSTPTRLGHCNHNVPTIGLRLSSGDMSLSFQAETKCIEHGHDCTTGISLQEVLRTSRKKPPESAGHLA